MILFCDTSALVKLYVAEEGSEQLLQRAAACDAVAVCRIAWVEVMSAMARRVREEPLDAPAIVVARQRFADDWRRFLIFEITQELMELAGQYAETYALRAFDSAQLAAARIADRELPGQVELACFDSRLSRAAQALGIKSV